MTVNKRIIRVSSVLAMCMLMTMSVLAQDNLLPIRVSNFNINYIGNGHTTSNLSNVGVATDYDYVYTDNGLQGDACSQHYAIGSNARWYSHNSVAGVELGMFDFADHTTGDGNYMIVNGAVASNKRVWEYTVDVTPGVEYQFQAYVTSLYINPIGNVSESQKPKLQLKINGANVGSVFTVPWNNNSGQWVEWTQNWTADYDVTSATITIIDNCTSGNGNDFGLDDLSFAANATYSVTANSDVAFACLNHGAIEIDVLDNDVFQPGPNNIYTSVEVFTPQDQIPGTTTNVSVNNNKIYYVFDDADYEGTTADFQYKVTFIGGSTSVNWVHVSLGRPPTIGDISTIVPASVCAPTTLSLDSPSVLENGSDLDAQGWQMQIGGQWVAVPNTIEYEHNGCNIRYYAENGCDPSYSTPVSLTVNAAPIVGSITAPSAACQRDSFDLETPQITWRYNDPSACWGSWEIQINGVWDSLVNENIPFEYNGCLIRYKAVNGCDTTYSTNTVPVTVYSTESVYEGVITACDPIYHHGQYCEDSGLYVAEGVETPDGCQIQVSWHFSLGEAYVALPETLEECDSYYWPRTGQTYYTDTIAYDTVYRDNPQVCDSIFTMELTINHAPSIQGDIQIDDICSGDLLAVTEPEPEYNHSEGGYSQWQYADSPDGTFQAFAPETYHFGYGSYYIRFAAINGCDDAFSNVVQVYVTDHPVISGQLGPLSVCQGNLLDLPEVNIDWRNGSQDGVFEWQIAETQEGQYDQLDSTVPIQMEQNGHWVRFMAYNECDTAYLGPVRVTVVDVQDVTIDHGPECDSVLFNGVYYKNSTIIDEPVDEPCPHTIHHNIIVNHSDYKEIERTTCKEFFDWHGFHLEHSDETQYREFDTVNMYGCDSVVVLKLDFGTLVNEFDTLACEPFEWYGFVCNDYMATMTIHHDFETEQGCDSTVIKHVKLNRVETKTQLLSKCDSYLSPYDGVLYDEPGVYTINIDTVFNQQGCDSIIHRIRLLVKDSGQMGLINGNSDVFVASNLVSGIYRYEINPEEVQGNISWSLSDPDWQIVEAQQNYCKVFVTTPGTATLSASFRTPECGEIERSFEIHAGFFGVDDHDAITVNVYPNPTNGIVTVEAEGIESIRLTNMMGQVLDWCEYDRSNTVVLNLDGIAPSVYLLEIKTVNGMAKRRVMVSQ